jgi:hypothetical protein
MVCAPSSLRSPLNSQSLVEGPHNEGWEVGTCCLRAHSSADRSGFASGSVRLVHNSCAIGSDDDSSSCARLAATRRLLFQSVMSAITVSVPLRVHCLDSVLG